MRRKILLSLGLLAACLISNAGLAQGYPTTRIIEGVKFLHLGRGVYGSGPQGGPTGGVASFVLVDEGRNLMCGADIRTPVVDYWGQSREIDGTLTAGISDGRGPVTRIQLYMTSTGRCGQTILPSGGSRVQFNAPTSKPATPPAPAPVRAQSGGGNLPTVNTSKASYCNNRFRFCITAPPTLYSQGEADAGDGVTFLTRDSKVTLRAWGAWGDVPGLPTYETAYRNASRGWPSGDGKPARVVTYTLFKDDFFVVSGVEKGQVFYQRTIRNRKTGNYATYLLTYPKGDKRGDSFIKTLSAQFGFY